MPELAGSTVGTSSGASLTQTGAVPADLPLLEVTGLRVLFPVRRGVLQRRVGWVRAVDDISFSIRRGRTLAIVGESGSGKTTTARAVMRVEKSQAGSIRLDGEELTTLSGAALRHRRRRIQMVFQDPFSSLDPRQSVRSILEEPMRVHGLGSRDRRRARVAELLQLVGLDPQFEDRYPHEFSGGQRQRIGVARALAVEPDLIVCDEPISSLDVSIQAQVINLLKRLQRDLGLTYLFIAHDLAVVRHVADDVAVMYLGKLVETGPSSDVYTNSAHPYTKALLSAAPVPDASVERSRRRIILKGDIPSAEHPPSGCRFHTRCWLREKLGNPEVCVTVEPQQIPIGPAPVGSAIGHSVSCHFPDQA
jgi:oligopeptide/dipeptide ABC transporter ATP-binding protein